MFESFRPPFSKGGGLLGRSPDSPIAMGETLLPPSGGAGVHPPKRKDLSKTKFCKLKKRSNKVLPSQIGGRWLLKLKLDYCCLYFRLKTID